MALAPQAPTALCHSHGSTGLMSLAMPPVPGSPPSFPTLECLVPAAPLSLSSSHLTEGLSTGTPFPSHPPIVPAPQVPPGASVRSLGCSPARVPSDPHHPQGFTWPLQIVQAQAVPRPGQHALLPALSQAPRGAGAGEAMVRARQGTDGEGAAVGSRQPRQSWGERAATLLPCPCRDLPAEGSPALPGSGQKQS